MKLIEAMPTNEKIDARLPPVVPDRRYPEFDPLHDRGGIWVF
jgi:hypothetical protein